MLPEIVKNVKTTLFGYLVQRCAILDLESGSISFSRELVVPKLARRFCRAVFLKSAPHRTSHGSVAVHGTQTHHKVKDRCVKAYTLS